MIGKTVSFLAVHKKIVYSLFAAVTIATLFITLIPMGHFQDKSIILYDKVIHFLIFFGWTFMLGFSLIIRNKNLAPLFGIFLAGTLFGITIEIVQNYLPYNRFASYKDIIANMAGSFAAVVLLWGIQTKYQSYLKPLLKKSNINRRNTLDS